MSDLLRTLNADGITAFSQYLQSLREGSTAAPPFHLLTDPQTSEALDSDVTLQAQSFSDGFAFGKYLAGVLSVLDRGSIAFNHSLWSWLALYYFDQICPVENGKRSVLEDAVYVLAETFNHRRYYRHLVRTPWEAVDRNGESAKVLLQTRGGGKRSDIFEQLAARQTIFGNKTIIDGAYELYYDVAAQLPKRGAGGKGAGSPRRLVSFIQQIDLTYDLQACTPKQFIDLLPKEFAKFSSDKAVAEAS
jgi:hypothetical protein